MIRFVIVALAIFGAYALYQLYGHHLPMSGRDKPAVVLPERR